MDAMKFGSIKVHRQCQLQTVPEPAMKLHMPAV